MTKLKVYGILVVTAVITVAGTIGWLSTPKASMLRAETSMDNFIDASHLRGNVERSNCSFDNDGDGYASCTIKTKTGEVIMLQCSSSIISAIPAIGAAMCKEQMNEVLKLQKVR